MSKKSQIAIFLIFALIFVVAFFYFTFSETKAKEESIKFDLKKIKGDNIVKKTKEYKSYFQICLDSVSQKAVAISGLQGGFIYFDDIGGYHMTYKGSIVGIDSYISNFTLYRTSLIDGTPEILVNSFYLAEVPKEKGNLTHINYSDSTDSKLLFYNKSISDDIGRFVVENYADCIENISELKSINYTDYSTDINKNNIKVDFSENDVFVNLKFPMNIRSESSIVNFEDITSIVSVPYREILKISEDMLRLKYLNRSLNFSDILENITLEDTQSDYISNLIFIEANFDTNPINDSKKFLAFIINNSNFVLGKPFMYQFGYLNNAPKITKITKSFPLEEFSPAGDYNTTFNLVVEENIPSEFEIFYTDNQPFDNSYLNPGGQRIEQNYITFNEYVNGDNYIKFNGGILEVKTNETIGDTELFIGDDEIKRRYILNFDVN